jgi:hypothetical protein
MTPIRFAAALAASACVCAASAALADTHWVVNGVFDDGTTLSGYFNLNILNYLGAFKLTTQTGTVLSANVYTSGGMTSPGSLTLDFEPTYQEELHLSFADTLDTSAPTNALLATSYECQESYNCYLPTGGIRRYIVSGSASAPEPAAWSLMLVGVAGLGATMRRRRHASASGPNLFARSR